MTGVKDKEGVERCCGQGEKREENKRKNEVEYGRGAQEEDITQNEQKVG